MGKSWIGNIPNTHVRDFQRKRLYNAEDTCSFMKQLEVLSYADVVNLVVRISDWAGIPVPSVIEEGHTLAYATADEIVLPYPITKSVPYIVHEMSHVINYNSTDADHHGEHFASTYLEVVNTFIGRNAYYELRDSFDKYKVRYLTANLPSGIMSVV